MRRFLLNAVMAVAGGLAAAAQTEPGAEAKGSAMPAAIVVAVEGKPQITHRRTTTIATIGAVFESHGFFADAPVAYANAIDADPCEPLHRFLLVRFCMRLDQHLLAERIEDSVKSHR